jgi:type IX secretion system PorP/SprF family membrane protein
MKSLKQTQVQLPSFGKQFFWAFCVVVLPFVASAQDAGFSMLYLNKLQLNPAYAGINRDLNASMVNRIQWAGLPGRMESRVFNADVSCPSSKLGFGIGLFEDIAGDAAFKHTGGAVTLAAHIPSKYPRNFGWRKMRNRKYIMSAALNYSVSQKMVDWSKLVFSDQLDAALGLIRPTSIVPQGADVSNLIHDISAGILFRTELNKEGSFLSLGIAASHLNQPVETFFGQENTRPVRFTAHSHANFRISKKYSNVIPQFLTAGLIYDRQAPLQTMMTGASFTFGKDFILGLWYRNRRFYFPETNMDAIVVNLIYSTKSFSVGYSYDITVSKLGLDRTYGSHEIGINYRFNEVYLCKKKSKRGRADRNCFLLDKKFMDGNQLINFLP